MSDITTIQIPVSEVDHEYTRPNLSRHYSVDATDLGIQPHRPPREVILTIGGEFHKPMRQSGRDTWSTTFRSIDGDTLTMYNE